MVLCIGNLRSSSAQIINREVELNDIVYDLFDLTAEERILIERESKYGYGGE